MKSLPNFIKESMSRKYQLSYDTLDCDRHFSGNYDEARRYILCVLANTPLKHISSYCASTIILDYDNEEPRLFKYIRENLSSYFYYSISLVSKTSDNNHVINHHPNTHLDTSIKREFKELTCNNLGKDITNY